MSLKAELETWAAALKAYDEEDFEKALDLFEVSIARIALAPLAHPKITSASQTRPRF
jgi:hypothetical protein